MPAGLLLLHAFPLDASMWQAQVEGLGLSMPIVAPDLPGFGAAPGVGPVTSLEAMADAGVAAAQAAGLDRVVVCGLSMGGYAALALWRKHRRFVVGMALANTRGGADDEAGKGRRATLAERLRAEGTGFLVDAPPPLLSEGAPADLVARVKTIIAAQPAEGIAAASLGMAERPDSSDLLPRLDVPVTVITSTNDTLIPPAATEEMAQRIEGAEFRMIEGAGHLSNLEAPEQFNILLREFISQRRAW
ncbi:MAG: alpha/beta fold hydrolase [Dehalococcoidia bacterium]